MGDLGFWALAQEDPDYLALVTPEGDEVTAGELLGRANQVVHALRAQGLGRGDVVATLLPNCAEMLEIYLAALQAGWYLVPINHHLVAPEVAYILKDSEAKVFVAHERFADVALAAADEAGVAGGGRLAVGDIRLHPLRPGARRAADDLPDNRTVGDVMNYTSGTTGNPKGIYRTLMGATPEQAALGLSGLLFLFGIQPQDDNVHIVGSPLYHTAVLRFGSASLHFGHTVVLMDKWPPEDMLRLIQKHRVTTSHMVPDPVPPAARAARRRARQVRRLVAAPHDPRRRPLPRRRQAPDDRLVGHGRRRVLRRLRGRRHAGQRRGLAEEARHGRQAVADLRDRHLRRRRQPDHEPNVIGTVYMAMQSADFEYHKDKEKTRNNRIGDFFTVGDVGLIDEDGYLFLRDRKIDMIISGGANIYPAEIENVLLAPKVGDAAVFGIPHDDWGEEVKAVVEPAEGIEATTRWPKRSGRSATASWPSSRRRRRSTSSTRCPATPTASSTSASSATPTGKASSGPSDRPRCRCRDCWSMSRPAGLRSGCRTGARPHLRRDPGRPAPLVRLPRLRRRLRRGGGEVAHRGGHLDGRDCGILTLRLHSPYAAEIVVMGVLPELHRSGIGWALLEAAESWLAERDIGFLQVKTLSPRSPDEGYAATRAFYFGCGFRPLEEMPELWGRDQPALQMIKTVPPLPSDSCGGGGCTVRDYLLDAMYDDSGTQRLHRLPADTRRTSPASTGSSCRLPE